MAGVAKAEIIAATTRPAGDSRQKSDEDADYTFGIKEVINPPEDPDLLASLSSVNSTRRSIINAIARNTVGLGYDLGVREGHQEELDDPDTTIRACRDRLEACARRDVMSHMPSFTDLMMRVKTDEEETILGALEVSRNLIDGRINGLFHVPGRRVRRLRDRSGWIVLDASGDPDRAVVFANFGENVIRDPRGLPSAVDDKTMNELLVFCLYTSESRDYGLPRDSGMSHDYAGDRLAAESNMSFFDSSGTPPTLVFVQGEETKRGDQVRFTVPQGTVQKIGETIKADGGHMSRVALIPLPPNSKVDKVELGKISDRDIGFTSYREDITARQLAAFRMSGIFIASSADGARYDAEVERAITLEQVFDPEQDSNEQRVSDAIIRDMGFPDLQLRYKRLAVESDQARRDSADSASGVGVITRGEFRAAHNLDPLPEADQAEAELEWNGATYKSVEPKTGQVPHGWNAELIPASQLSRNSPAGQDTRGLQPGVGQRMSQSSRRARSQSSAAAQQGAAALADKLRQRGVPAKVVPAANGG